MDSVYIACGAEIGRRDTFIKSIRDNCVKAWGKEIEFYKLYSTESSIADLEDTLYSTSLFSSGKFIQYIGAETIKGKADTSIIVDFIKKPCPNTVLVLVSDSFGLDKSIENAVSKDAKKIFWEISEKDASSYVNDYFREQEISVSNDVVEKILFLVENNTKALGTECARLALFFPKGSTIKSEDIENYISHIRSEDAFSLFSCMATDTFEKSLETLDAILSDRETNGIGLISVLLWSFKRLSSLHEDVMSGTPFEQAARNLRITRKTAMADYSKAMKRWPKDVCDRLIAFASETDVKLREMGSANERTLLELFIYACVVKKAPVLI